MCLVALLIVPQFVNSQTINITITNIKNAKGQVGVYFFTNEQEFKTEKSVYERFYDKTTLKNDTIIVTVSHLKAGTYGVVVYDDVNRNGKMDYNFIGMPVEGFGFSNYRLKLLKRPTFKDFCFEVKEEEQKQITVEMKYL